MAKYHINGKGEAGACSAQAGNCPFGDEDQHFTSEAAAREAYETSMANHPAFNGLNRSTRPGGVMFDPVNEQWVGSRTTVADDGDISRETEWFDTKEEAKNYASWATEVDTQAAPPPKPRDGSAGSAYLAQRKQVV